MVVYFPVQQEHFERSKTDVSIWEQVENVAQMQHYWADNQVSATVTFKPEEAKDIPKILELYETRLKSISFLPLEEHAYPQAPYQTITKETYEMASAKLQTLDFGTLVTDEAEDIFCDGDKCQLPPDHAQPETVEIEFSTPEEADAAETAPEPVTAKAKQSEDAEQPVPAK
ncbi:MAG: hypothetical protein IID08_00495, partial [Candidatus Hydrogenedentes bacterium]|nr:hypothetical protein [Candidatus Hydrogenedentota bacterium]